MRGAWIRFVRKPNPDLLGEHAELGEFLFGAPRAPLLALRAPLFQLQEEACFYCRRDGWRGVLPGPPSGIPNPPRSVSY